MDLVSYPVHWRRTCLTRTRFQDQAAEQFLDLRNGVFDAHGTRRRQKDVVTPGVHELLEFFEGPRSQVRGAEAVHDGLFSRVQQVKPVSVRAEQSRGSRVLVRGAHFEPIEGRAEEDSIRARSGQNWIRQR
jgi:hypothetical protein